MENRIEPPHPGLWAKWVVAEDGRMLKSIAGQTVFPVWDHNNKPTGEFMVIEALPDGTIREVFTNPLL